MTKSTHHRTQSLLDAVHTMEHQRDRLKIYLDHNVLLDDTQRESIQREVHRMNLWIVAGYKHLKWFARLHPKNRLKPIVIDINVT